MKPVLIKHLFLPISILMFFSGVSLASADVVYNRSDNSVVASADLENDFGFLPEEIGNVWWSVSFNTNEGQYMSNVCSFDNDFSGSVSVPEGQTVNSVTAVIGSGSCSPSTNDVYTFDNSPFILGLSPIMTVTQTVGSGFLDNAKNVLLTTLPYLIPIILLMLLLYFIWRHIKRNFAVIPFYNSSTGQHGTAFAKKDATVRYEIEGNGLSGFGPPTTFRKVK